ncbi:MAG: c-type cytochrome [Rhodobacteraceae bacterium]|jgi:CxxC motif-containing protein (DUF1111 family)|nr:c-type cytochrome [Paracoccaceae bacterium]
MMQANQSDAGRIGAGVLATAGLAAILGLGGALATTAADLFTDAAGPRPFAQSLRLEGPALDRFILGRSFFSVPWVQAPSATTARDGLGPHFNANTCASCHRAMGSAATLDPEGRPLRPLVFKLAQPGRHDDRGPVPEAPFADRVPDPVYGAQIAVNGTSDVAPEAVPRLVVEPLPYRYPDGTAVMLERLHPELSALAYGPLAPDTVIFLRQPPALAGLGLVAAVPEAEILALEDARDRDGDGISGRANRVQGPEGPALGRFGWKAATGDLIAQTAHAAAFDMGLTNPVYPQELCPPAQTDCQAAPRGRDTQQGALDLPAPRLEAIAAYLAGFRAPLPRMADGRGAALFAETGCTACHRPALTTADGVTLHPLSDYLLHDMGEGLADGIREAAAGPAEFRTAPLWGLGARLRAGHRFLHDARAATPEAAILWHGGEATAARTRFVTLDATDRAALLAYLESL